MELYSFSASAHQAAVASCHGGLLPPQSSATRPTGWPPSPIRLPQQSRRGLAMVLSRRRFIDCLLRPAVRSIRLRPTFLVRNRLQCIGRNECRSAGITGDMWRRAPSSAGQQRVPGAGPSTRQVTAAYRFDMPIQTRLVWPVRPLGTIGQSCGGSSQVALPDSQTTSIVYEQLSGLWPPEHHNHLWGTHRDLAVHRSRVS